MKRCSKCGREQSLASFDLDRTRVDGRCYICKSCRHPNRTGPTRGQRRAMAAIGWLWCRACRGWTSGKRPRQGLCAAHIAERDRRRYETDPAYRAERRQHAHARKRGVEPIPADAQADLLEEFGGVCAYCPRPATTWDHIVPISKGGRTTPGNVVPCCLSCNSSKKHRDPDEWLDEVAARGGSNPALSDQLARAEACI